MQGATPALALLAAVCGALPSTGSGPTRLSSSQAELVEGSTPKGADSTRFRFELEPSYVRNDLVRHYGLEDTYLLRGRLEARTELYPGANIYARVRWQPPLSEYSRGYLLLAEDPFAVQGAYVELQSGLGALRLGVVEFPVGTDDELFLDKSTFEPLLRERLPRFDVGGLYSAEGRHWRVDLALVNGEGGAYADANSDDTRAGRVSVILGPLELGLTGASGARHSTPVKEEEDCYGAFLRLRKGKLAVRAEILWSDWDFREDYTKDETLEEIQQDLHFGPAAYGRLEEYLDERYDVGAKHSLGWYLRLDWEASEKLHLFLHGGQWEPDMDVDWSEYAQMKTRIAAGGRYALRSEETHSAWFELFLSWTDDPTVDPERVDIPVGYVLALRVEKRF